jgi:hypothetical protein
MQLLSDPVGRIQMMPFMHTALSRIREFLVPGGRGQDLYQARSYCVCGALKPQQSKTADPSAERMDGGLIRSVN